MNTYHIHISGLVQGVGFRPFVRRLAEKMKIAGWVSNTTDGVHIEFNASADTATRFYRQVVEQHPKQAVITRHLMQPVAPAAFPSFMIKHGLPAPGTELLLTPDIAICSSCKRELTDSNNQRRYRYAFTTCLDCGPRYSIVTALPYDREHTTMADLHMCAACAAEYDALDDRRHYSQTNSCNDCAIEMYLYDRPEHRINGSDEAVLIMVQERLMAGGIVAIKGIGGYLLLCDATNETAIQLLRQRKHRPQKPFALLYPDLTMAGKDVQLHDAEAAALESAAAPIVICRLRRTPASGICTEQIAPKLQSVGVLLPYTPLLVLIATGFGKPLIATSANISGLPILYKDESATALLPGVADLVLGYHRDIVTPEDDSVICFTAQGERIIHRRSRGMAPCYLRVPDGVEQTDVLAIGGELKAAFAIMQQAHVLVSQYLGNHHTMEAQENYRQALAHILQLHGAMPSQVLIDKHPAYLSAQLGHAVASEYGVTVLPLLHHEAHFAAVLAENGLLECTSPVLGLIWDGAGYGADGQVWGGEALIYNRHTITRAAHLDYFPQLMGDKMSKEPRLSALALLQSFPEQHHLVQHYFTDIEWKYHNRLLQQESPLQTSSMGRLLDGVAAILGVTGWNTYEGEAVMKMEALATAGTGNAYYPLPVQQGIIQWQQLLLAVVSDLTEGQAIAAIARKVFCSLAQLVVILSRELFIPAIAFSGGVFQSALLHELIRSYAPSGIQLYFHKELSPNDECIGFGQIALLGCNKEK